MKIRKLLVLTLTAVFLCGGVNVGAYAAEATIVAAAETVTDAESTDKSTNENTEAAQEGSVTEEKSEEAKKNGKTDKKAEINIENEEKTEIENKKNEKTEKKEETKTETEQVSEEEKNAESEKTDKAAEKTEQKDKKNKKEKAEKKNEDKKDTAKNDDDKIEVKAIAKRKVPYTKAQLRLLSSLIFCEAGSEPYAGKLAVGIVVMNRVEAKSFPNTLHGVVYQKSQFGPARNGSLKRALENYDAGKFTTKNHKDSVKAAKAALKGAKLVSYKGKKLAMNDMLFFSGKVSGAKLSIANHQFK